MTTLAENRVRLKQNSGRQKPGERSSRFPWILVNTVSPLKLLFLPHKDNLTLKLLNLSRSLPEQSKRINGQ